MASQKIKEEFSIVNSETAELIVKICFLINDLKQNFGEDFVANEKNCLRCDGQIIKQMDAVLTSNRLCDFRNKLNDFIIMTDSYIEIYGSSNFTFSEKTMIQNILQNLIVSLKKLQQKTTA